MSEPPSRIGRNHIEKGSLIQVFYFIRPTPSNLAAYERWSGTEMQNHSWLGDMCDDVYKVELQTGNTMIIPTGWIHAVVCHFKFGRYIALRLTFPLVYTKGHASIRREFPAFI